MVWNWQLNFSLEIFVNFIKISVCQNSNSRHFPLCSSVIHANSTRVALLGTQRLFWELKAFNAGLTFCVLLILLLRACK